MNLNLIADIGKVIKHCTDAEQVEIEVMSKKQYLCENGYSSANLFVVMSYLGDIWMFHDNEISLILHVLLCAHVIIHNVEDESHHLHV